MSERKFKPTTRGGYWVRNIEVIETDSVYVLTGLVGNHSSEPPSDDPLDWHTETFTADGAYRVYRNETPFDLIEETENE